MEYVPGRSPAGAIGKRHIGELSRERGGSKHWQAKLKRKPVTHLRKPPMSQLP